MAGSSSDQDATTPLSYFKYDVFLSLRGSTRPNITDVLYHYLMDDRIETFKDDRELRPTEELEDSLLEAIERSRMSIVILCDGYPSSHWCLDELVKIMECYKGKKRPVLPVYFYVEKSDVQYQKNEFAASLARLVKTGRYTHKLKAWKSALCDVGKIYGQRIGEKTRWAEAIANIVKEVTRKLPPLPLYIDRPIGLDSELEEAKSLLEIDSHATCFMLGIHGDGDEISKFVAVLYNKIRPHFVAASFLSNVSEKTNESGGGLEDLQEKLLSEMGEDVKVKIGSTFKGSSEIKRRLGHKMVLLVLDDVDSIEQLNSLAGGTDWFGPGSRIIITTRYEYVLDEHVSTNGVVIKKYNISEGSSSTVKEENVMGLEKDFDMVINQLKDADSPENAVSIVGMPGLGKTTLARKVYNSIDVRKLFPCRAWATISQKPMLIQVLRNLLKCLKPKSKYENSSEGELKKKVRECLCGKKYLVVLDDVWDSDALRSCFPNDNNGSKILVTTRNDQVANAFESKIPHLTVSPLNEEESWELFHNEVFYSTTCPPELELIGKSIAESCKGLPLLIKARAGIVAKRERSEEAWNYLKDWFPSFSIAEYKEGKNMMELFKPSYDDLSPEMKPRFLYLGAFPEDEEILVRDLISMWIAEDFTKPRRSKVASAIEPEDNGEQYLKELVERKLVQVVKRRSDGKGVKTVKIHDLFRELCIFVSDSLSDSNNAPRFSFPTTSDVGTGSYACLVTCNQSNTCSLFRYGYVQRWSLSIPEDSQVNVLYFKGLYLDPTREDAEVLNKLKSARYWKLECAKVPRSIELDTLEEEEVKLSTLEKVNVLYTWKREETSIDERLKDVRHLRYDSGNNNLLQGAEGVEDKMKNVQTLLYVYADSQLGSLLNNGFFANLRTLGLEISGDEGQSVENLRSLHQLSKLSKLKLRFGTYISLGKIALPSNLTKITLKLFKDLKQEDMNALGRIPTLKILKLYGGECAENILHCGSAGSFPLLQVFIMERVTVTHVILEHSAMPKLRLVVFRVCPGLMFENIPEQMHRLGSNLHFERAGTNLDFEEPAATNEERRRCRI